MDNLAKDAFLARKNGMSYGQYMANKKPAYKTADAPRGAKQVLICAWCGKEFVRYDRRRGKYCSPECKEESYIATQRKCQKRFRGKSENGRDE